MSGACVLGNKNSGLSSQTNHVACRT